MLESKAWTGSQSRAAPGMHSCVVLLCWLVGAALIGLAVKMPRAEADAPGPLFRVWVNHKLGFMDRAGKVVIAPMFDRGSEFHEERAAVNVGANEYGNGGKWGYIDTGGRYIREPQLVEMPGDPAKLIGPTDPAMDFSEGLAAVLVNGKWGFMDRTGRMAIEPRFEGELSAGPFREGLAAVRFGGRWGYVDRFGEVVIAPRFEYAGSFSEGLAEVRLPGADGREGMVGYVDKAGKLVIRPRCVLARDFHEGLAFVQISWGTARESARGGWIDKTGRMVIGPMRCETLSSTAPPIVDFSEGLVSRKVGSGVGYLGKTGRFVISPRFRAAGSFSEGLAAVLVGDKWGYIDRKGKFVIKPTFRMGMFPDLDIFGRFDNGLALIMTSCVRGYIDRTGRFVWRETSE